MAFDEIKSKCSELISSEFSLFSSIRKKYSIVSESIPILWFGDVEQYLRSSRKILTVSLNPSDNEFKTKSEQEYSTAYRFPTYNGSIPSLYDSYNEYFRKQPYGKWFKASFGAVLSSFSSSHYGEESNTALHTDIGSPFATSPTWSKLDKHHRASLESYGSKSWHRLVQILEPDVILFSASRDFQRKILLPQIGTWIEIDVGSDTPLLSGTFQVSHTVLTSVLFQIQGRMPFLRTRKEEKEKFATHIQRGI